MDAGSSPNWLYATPLVLTLLPLSRHIFKNNVVGQRVFFGIVAVGLLHGVSLIASAGGARGRPPAVDAEPVPLTRVAVASARAAPPASAPAPAATPAAAELR